MPFSIRPHRRFPVQCSVTYKASSLQGQVTVWNLDYESFVSEVTERLGGPKRTPPGRS